MRKLLQILMLLTALHMISSGTSEDPRRPLAPALHVFGDSLLDAGNNNDLPTISRANFAPYGMNFEGGPTGRFTDGRTVADFISEFIGLPYSTAFLSLKEGVIGKEHLKGLNYASAGCGILPDTGTHLGLCLNLTKQIDLFERTVKEELPKHFNSSKDLSNYLSKSVFLISTGNNDYINNYLDVMFHNSSKIYSPQSFADFLLDNLSKQFQRLYELGARKVVMFEVGPIGCMPCSLRLFNHTGKCVEHVNQLALIFNKRLAPMLQKLRANLEGSSFVIGRVYGLAYHAITHPSQYGLSDSSNPCCEAWFNGSSACIPELSALTCRNPEKHFFFDGYHLTETVYQITATRCFNGSSICIPNNIKHLLLQS